MKHVISPARHISEKGLIGLELDMPEISIELPTPAEMAKHTARIVAARLQATIKAGQAADGTPLRAPSQATLERRARDANPPRNPRSNRWIQRYPGRVRAMLAGKLTPGRIKRRTTVWRGGVFYKRTTVYKNLNVSQLAAVDSGTLWQRIRLAASGAGSAEVEAPPGRPVADIEQRLGASIFAATPAHLDEALEDIMEGALASWGGPASALRKVL